MRDVLLLLRHATAAVLSAALMGLHAPAIAAGMGENVHASNADCAGMPAESCDDMAACAERSPFAVHAAPAPQPALQVASAASSSSGFSCSAPRMPVARIARYGPPAYLRFCSFLL
jgi:hypothetical protein